MTEIYLHIVARMADYIRTLVGAGRGVVVARGGFAKERDGLCGVEAGDVDAAPAAPLVGDPARGNEDVAVLAVGAASREMVLD